MKNLNFTKLKCAICKSSIKSLPSIIPEINPMSDLEIKKKLVKLRKNCK